MNWLDGKIKDESNSKIEIVNIESTLIIPFKIGDMASSVSLISIAKIASYAMPVFMVLVGFTVRHAENRDDESYENKGYIIDIPTYS